MKRIALWAFVGFVAAFGTAGCDRSAKSPQSCQGTPDATTPASDATQHDNPRAVPTHPLPRPLFWSIEKDGKTSYALGTMHGGVDAHERLPTIVWDKLDAAKTFAMETDTADPALASM